MSYYVELPRVALPGPPPLPLLGARGNLVRFLGDPVPTMLRLHERYGDVVPLTRDDPGWVLAFGPALNRQILSDTARFHNFADNPIRVPPGSAAAKFSLNLVNQNGDVHRRARRWMMPAFHKARLLGYANMMAETVGHALDRRSAGEVVDARELAVELSLGVALRCLFGVELRTNLDFGELVLDFLERVFSPAAMLLPLGLPGTPYTRFIHACERLGARIEQLIAERRRAGLAADVLSALIGALEADPDRSDDELIGQTALLLVAGHETTAHTLAWTLFLLSQHPDVQVALTEEIDAAGLGERPELDAIMGLPLLGRVLAESMRLLPTVPLLFFRRSTEPFSLGDHQLPVGATVILSPLITHRDPDCFPHPRRFDPDRWRELSPTPYQYLPFGAGPRMCVGATFGGLALRLMLCLVLRRWLVSVTDDARVSYKTAGVTMGPKRGLRLRLLARDRLPSRVEVRGNIHQLVELRG
ncbi:MAG TPA: cytochrome P450 [Enhygromyxa sp.]|nr:cytochrome P450 [Enhygromyxa sp.]